MVGASNEEDWNHNSYQDQSQNNQILFTIKS